jgi:hypothetical protein
VDEKQFSRDNTTVTQISLRSLKCAHFVTSPRKTVWLAREELLEPQNDSPSESVQK